MSWKDRERESGTRTLMLRFSQLVQGSCCFLSMPFPQLPSLCHLSLDLIYPSSCPSFLLEVFLLTCPRNQFKSERIIFSIFDTLKFFSAFGQNFPGYFCTEIWENSFVKRTFFRTLYLTTNGLIGLNTTEGNERECGHGGLWGIILWPVKSVQRVHHNQNQHLTSAVI